MKKKKNLFGNLEILMEELNVQVTTCGGDLRNFRAHNIRKS